MIQGSIHTTHVHIWRRCWETTRTCTRRKTQTTPGHSVPTHVTPFDIDYETKTEGDIELTVRRLRRNRADWHTHLWAEHLQKWLGETHIEETSTVLHNPTYCIK